MKRIYIDKLNKDFKLELCKVNRDVICSIPRTSIESLTRSLTDIDKLEIVIDKYIVGLNGKKILNPLWLEIKEERLIRLNDSEYFVIKVKKFIGTEDKLNIVAYSLEYKLGKIDILLEDIAFYLMEEDVESGIYNLNDYMYLETGWRFGHIDDSVRYDIVEGVKSNKLRLFPSIDKRWYDFLVNDVSESFNCLVVFNSWDKTVVLYDSANVSENIEIYLSKDNYVKSIERSSSSDGIVTRMNLTGLDEMDIIGATCTGYPYVENYSYFIESGEMSKELIMALNKYTEMIQIRQPIWENLIESKNEQMSEFTAKKNKLYSIYEEVRALKSIKETYIINDDDENEMLIVEQLTKKINQQLILESEVKELEYEITTLQKKIDNINLLCKRETATYKDGKLIFTDKTLDELKEFIYCETYANDSFLEVKDLIDAGLRELDLSCYPSVSYDLNIKNFLERVIYEKFRMEWKGTLGLGDIVILYDHDIDNEVFLYLTDYIQRPNKDIDNSLEITLSNKKYKDKNIRTIADKLKEGTLAMRNIKKKSYILNNIKYNRINMSREQVGGNI